MQLDNVVNIIEQAFGESPPFSGRPLLGDDIAALQRVFGDSGYQAYLQDQVNRQIIRDYLTNAVLLGFLCEEGLASLAGQVASSAGRAALSLHMLMNSVENASELVRNEGLEPLEALAPVPDSPSHLKLVPS